MKFVAIDIETTGLNCGKDQILEFAAIAVDTTTPPSAWLNLHAIISYLEISGSPYAIHMNHRIIDMLVKYDKDRLLCPVKILSPEDLLPHFRELLKWADYESNSGHVSLTIAGKNVAGFDIPFLKNHFNKHNGTSYGQLDDDPQSREVINFRKRCIDPAVLYCDFINDEKVPDLSTCKKRAGLPEHVSHNAFEDAWDIVALICKHAKIELAP